MIIVCSVTGSTQAGMVAGFAALQDAGSWPRRVIGVDASPKPEHTRDQITRIARHTAQLIGLRRELRQDEISSTSGTTRASTASPIRPRLTRCA